MRWVVSAIALLCAAPAAGQVAYPPLDPATVTQTATQAAQAAIPPVCSTPPAMDTTTGTTGSGSPCTHRADAASKTVIQAKTTNTAADATYTVTWDAPFATTPIYADARVDGQSAPYLCTVTATATGASGKCFQLVATTLPTLSTSLLGLVVSPVTNAAGNLPVRVVARQ